MANRPIPGALVGGPSSDADAWHGHGMSESMRELLTAPVETQLFDIIDASITGWTVGTGDAVAADTTPGNFLSGSRSVRFTVGAGHTGLVGKKTFTGPLDLTRSSVNIRYRLPATYIGGVSLYMNSALGYASPRELDARPGSASPGTLIYRITASSTRATGGTFTLTVNGQTTAAIAFNAAAAAIDAALEALTAVGVGGVACVDYASGLGANNGYCVMTFTGTQTWPLTVTMDTSSLTGAGTWGSHVLSGGEAWHETGPMVLGNLPGTNTFKIAAAATPATDGTFTITIDGQTTGALNHDIATADLLTAVRALSSIGAAANVTAAETGGGLGTGNGYVTLTFAAALALKVVAASADFSGLVGNPHTSTRVVYDPAAVTGIWFGVSGSAEAQYINVDEVHILRHVTKPKARLFFRMDDAKDGQYDSMKAVLAQHDVRGFIGVIAGSTSGREAGEAANVDTCTIAELREMLDAGHLLCVHWKTQDPGRAAAEQIAGMKYCQSWLRKVGLGNPGDRVAIFPGHPHRCQQTTLDAIWQSFDLFMPQGGDSAQFVQAGGSEFYTSLATVRDWHIVGSPAYDSGIIANASISGVIGAGGSYTALPVIDKVIENGWLCGLLVHDVGAGYLSVAEFTAVMAYIQTKVDAGLCDWLEPMDLVSAARNGRMLGASAPA